MEVMCGVNYFLNDYFLNNSIVLGIISKYYGTWHIISGMYLLFLLPFIIKTVSVFPVPHNGLSHIIL